MRARTFILLILVLLVFGAAAVLVVINLSNGGGLFGSSTADGGDQPAIDGGPSSQDEPGVPPPGPTPTPDPLEVVVARVNLPVGQRLTEDVLTVERRPPDNWAFKREGGYTFTNMEDLVGKVLKVSATEGQAILVPMLALSPTDLAEIGSDLALYVDQGNVAIAFPLRLTDESPVEAARKGAAFAMRPGDLVDVMMSLRLVAIDPEFHTALPNITRRVYETGLLEGQQFLFPETIQGRLEFIPEINQVGEIVPMDTFVEGQDFEPGSPIPKRVTQLTIQKAEVLWVGTWRNQDDLLEELQPTPVPLAPGGRTTAAP